MEIYVCSGLFEQSVLSQVSVVEECPLSEVPQYTYPAVYKSAIGARRVLECCD